MSATSHAPAPAAAPDWDMTPYFPALGGPEYCAFRDALAASLRDVRASIDALGPLDGATAPSWSARLVELEEISARLRHLSSYLACLGAADSRDERVARESSALAGLRAELDKIYTAARAALGEARDEDFESLCDRPELSAARYALTRLRARAARMMPTELERLASDLGVDGISAWSRLYNRIAGALTFELFRPGGESERVPVAMTRTLLEDPDPDIRRAALRGSGRAWEGVAVSVAACLNAISGTRLTLLARRGARDALEPALFDAGIERATLDALFAAVRGRQELPRRYLRRKAELLGQARLGFQDLIAPLPAAARERIPWSEARRRVTDAFAGAYPALAELSERALAERWIDYAPRPGKRPGGFCSTSPVIGQSRVFMNYGGAVGDVQTLAHELGHAFHGWMMRDLRPFARQYPMTLAETASTFAESLVTDAVLSDPDAGAPLRLAVLERRMQEAATFLLNIPTRFDFERSLYERRTRGELSARELCELMREAQARNYGDALDPDELDPWLWANKLHFYMIDVCFYNFPYTFGYLFSRAIAARAKAEGPSFLPTYERLLRATGSDTAENVALDILGVDLTSPAFWSGAIDLIEADFDRFEEAVAEV